MIEKIETVDYQVVQDPLELVEYERQHYHALATRPTFSGALERMDIIDGNRVRPRLPYKNLKVIALKINGRIVGGIKLVKNPELFELNGMGFKIDLNEPGICEGINFFAVADGFDILQFFTQVIKFLDHCLEKLSGEGIRKVYGTCGDKVLRMYQQAGFEIVEQREINSNMVYLIQLLSTEN